MKRGILLAALAACGSDASAPDSSDIIGEAGFAERMTLAGDCLVVSRGGMLVCLPRSGGEPRDILSLPGRQIAESLGDGDSVIVAHRGLEDAADERDLRIDRVALDGTITPIGGTDAAPDSGEGLALAGSAVVFSSGGSGQVSTLPIAGGTRTIIVNDGGNIGDLAVLGSTAYFVNSPSVRAHPIGGPLGRGETVASIVAFDTRLTSDGERVVAASPGIEGADSTIHVLPDATSYALPGRTGRVAAADGTAWVIVDDDIVSIDLATGSIAEFQTATLARDIVVDADRVYWVTSAGHVRAASR